MIRELLSKLFASEQREEEINDNISIGIESFSKKYNTVYNDDYDLKNKVISLILRGDKFITISKSKLAELDSKLKNKTERYDLLSSTAALNNQGIKEEKALNYDKAIELYEENIKGRYPATHSYERLMILYHKRKDYINEIRVTEIALNVFSIENKERYEIALSESKNQNFIKEINAGYEMCENVRGKDGWIIYSPYPVKKYELRLEKIKKLLIKE